MSTEGEEEDVHFKPGQIIESSKAKYVVVKLLGEGGFGAVYRVRDEKVDNVFYAMKVEKKKEDKKSKLKMEVYILKMAAEKSLTSHFTRIVDRGKRDTYCFIVMQLVGKCLADLKAKRPDKVLTFGCGLNVSVQCLEAVQDLHKCGFIHRDLKPANYAVGLGCLRHQIYILDFGIARKILNDKNELKTPRQKAGFKGTIKFAALSCHKNIEMGPKDDCESWFYLLMDLVQPHGLPWKKMQARDDVMRMKEECRRGDRREQLLGGIKAKNGGPAKTDELGKILDYIDTLRYHDHVDYAFIHTMLRTALFECGAKSDDFFDWEIGVPITDAVE